ncbi:MAG: acyl-CoA dehydrogenase family protein, partial [Prolixibacteraceae bacterium]|nr:acyl-CoA dehydrogenase family protein [Prolixibacteraceae bacterium]
MSIKENDILKKFRSFSENKIAPHASYIDEKQNIPEELLTDLKKSGFLGVLIPKEFGGLELNYIDYGLLNEEIGKVCTTIRSLITVQNMVAVIINRYGDNLQKSKWLPKMASG